MQQGSSSAILTDEQIIGLDPAPPPGAAENVAQGAPAPQVRVAPESNAGDPEDFSDVLGDGSVARVARQTTQSDMRSDAARDPRLLDAAAPENASGLPNAGRPELQNAPAPAPQSDPAWLRTLEAQPQGGREAAAEARSWRAAATDVAALDAAYFSASPDARAGLAARLYDSDPAAFRAMLAESARVIAQRDPQALAELARQLGAPAAPPSLRSSVARVAREGNQGDTQTDAARDPRLFAPTGAENASGLSRETRDVVSNIDAGRPELQNANPAANANAGVFPADAYRSFEAATNEDVARRVHQAIDHTLSTTLPEGAAEGARRRIAADIFQEVQASLAADRDLTRRVGETLRDWRFDAAARQQVASLLSGRARAVLPEVARRVVTEWTSSVLASDRARTARLDAAAARREVSGGRLPEPVPAGALRPRDIDYRRTSDDQILDM